MVPVTEDVPKSPIDAPIITPKTLISPRSPWSPRHSSATSETYSDNKFQFNSSDKQDQQQKQHYSERSSIDSAELFTNPNSTTMTSLSSEQPSVLSPRSSPFEETEKSMTKIKTHITTPHDAETDFGINLLNIENNISEIIEKSETLSSSRECASNVAPGYIVTPGGKSNSLFGRNNVNENFEPKQSPIESRNEEIMKTNSTKVFEVSLPKLEINDVEHTAIGEGWKTRENSSPEVEIVAVDLPNVDRTSE